MIPNASSACNAKKTPALSGCGPNQLIACNSSITPASTSGGRERSAQRTGLSVLPQDLALFNALRGLRAELAREQNVPAYVIFHDSTLRAIAEATGGEYFRARDSEELQAIEATLDRLEPVAQKPTLARPTLPLYPWPLGLALLFSLLLVSQTLWPSLQQRWRTQLTRLRGKPS